MILIIAIVLIFLAYAFLIGMITIGWFRTPVYITTRATPVTKMSVILPARNEERNIKVLLDDLLIQDYPVDLMEIIVIDDHSYDKTNQIVRSIIKSAYPSVRLLEMHDSGNFGKKAALELGIKEATGKVILTTDADCRVNPNWVRSMAAYYESFRPKMILAPVQFNHSRNFFRRCEELEFMSLIATSAGSAGFGFPLLANGANLAYEREAFLQSGGFSENASFTSGDDMFMMLKIKQLYGKGSIRFVKSTETLVSTDPEKTLEDFLSQRLRWVSKSRGYKDPAVLASSIIVYLTNLALAVVIIGGLFSSRYIKIALGIYLIKLLIDFPVMIGIAGFLGKRKLVMLFPLLELMNVYYTVIIGFWGNLRSFTWKGRMYKSR